MLCFFERMRHELLTYAPGGAGDGRPERLVIPAPGDERLAQQKVAGVGIGRRHHHHDEQPRRDARHTERPRDRQHRPAVLSGNTPRIPSPSATYCTPSRAHTWHPLRNPWQHSNHHANPLSLTQLSHKTQNNTDMQQECRVQRTNEVEIQHRK